MKDASKSAPVSSVDDGLRLYATWSDVVYLVFAVYVSSRRIVGWRTARAMATALLLDMLEIAIWV
jgi:transposase InsO family protein